MRTVVTCTLALALCGGCHSIRHQYRTYTLPNGDQVQLVRQHDGVDAVAVDCRMIYGNEVEIETKCLTAVWRICRSPFDIVGGTVGPYMVHARCWNQRLPWAQESPERICSNGGATSGAVSFDVQTNGTTLAFAQRANVYWLLHAFGAHDPTLRFLLADDWATAFCWGGVWRADDPEAFWRHMRAQGATIERRDDGVIEIRNRISKRRR